MIPKSLEKTIEYEELIRQIIANAEVLPIDSSRLNPTIKQKTLEEGLQRFKNISQESLQEYVRTLVNYAAYLFYQLGDEERSLRAYGMVLKLDKNEEVAHHHVGRILMNNGSYENALQLFEKGLKLENTGSWLHREFHFDISDLGSRLERENPNHPLSKRIFLGTEENIAFRHYMAGKLETIEEEPHTSTNCPYNYTI